MNNNEPNNNGGRILLNINGNLTKPDIIKKQSARVEKIRPTDCLWGQEWIDYWIKEGSAITFNNETPLLLLSYLILGHRLRHILIKVPVFDDLRVHLFWVQPSRTGKSRAMDTFLIELCREISIDLKEVGVASGPALIGSHEGSGLLEEYNHSILWFDEVMNNVSSAKARGVSADDIFDVLRMGLNPRGHVVKSLAGRKYDYYTKASCIFLTTPADAQLLSDQAIKGGFLGRTFPFFRDISTELRMAGETKLIMEGRYINDYACKEICKTLAVLPEPYVEDVTEWRAKLVEGKDRLQYVESKYAESVRGNSINRICKIAYIRSSLFQDPAEYHINEAVKLENLLLKSTTEWLSTEKGGINELLEYLAERLPKEGWTTRDIYRHCRVFNGKADSLKKVIFLGRELGYFLIERTGKSIRVIPTSLSSKF